MCGIVGVTSQRNIHSILLEGLRRLEYRGYDSAGIAVIHPDNTLKCIRTQGKVQVLIDEVMHHDMAGYTGIAHTRWATHGKVSEQNAHPQISHDEIAVVHNGIIENYEALRERLKALDYVFTSETDTEAAVHLIHYYYGIEPDLLKAVQKASKDMQGAFALGVIHRDHPGVLVAIRKGSPLVLGVGIGEMFIASDPLALRSFAQSVIYLEEGDAVFMTPTSKTIYDTDSKVVERVLHDLKDDATAISKGPYRHFMLKEIHEQAKALEDTCEGRIASPEVLRASFGHHFVTILPKIESVHIVACGTSYHAGLIARYWIESLAGLPVQVDIASEYRYREILVKKNTLFIAISQSGETADTLAALHKAKTLGYLGCLAICNVASSSLVRESDMVFLTRAGIEIGVASTKAFTTQLMALLMLSLALSHHPEVPEILKSCETLPAICKEVLAMQDEIEALARHFIHADHALFLGRGTQYPVALEGALKLKEISYIHAEAYPAGELKHGPLALVDKDMPVIAIAAEDGLLDKLKSNLHEVSARGGSLFVFVDKDHVWKAHSVHCIPMPKVSRWLAPIVYTIPLQLLAYYVAVGKGTDVDQPRNLAKSVTVE